MDERPELSLPLRWIFDGHAISYQRPAERELWALFGDRRGATLFVDRLDLQLSMRWKSWRELLRRSAVPARESPLLSPMPAEGADEHGTILAYVSPALGPPVLWVHEDDRQPFSSDHVGVCWHMEITGELRLAVGALASLEGQTW